MKKLREAHNLSREKLAGMIDVGVAQIYRYETGENNPSSDVVVRMAQVFNVSTDYLLGLTDSPNPHLDAELNSKEAEAINAWRRGGPLAAIKAIIGDE